MDIFSRRLPFERVSICRTVYTMQITVAPISNLFGANVDHPGISTLRFEADNRARFGPIYPP